VLLGILLRVARPSARLKQDEPFSGMVAESRDHNTSLSMAFSVGIGLYRGATAANEETEIGFQVAEMEEPELRAYRGFVGASPGG
jgi:hypothetical protein